MLERDIYLLSTFNIKNNKNGKESYNEIFRENLKKRKCNFFTKRTFSNPRIGFLSFVTNIMTPP